MPGLGTSKIDKLWLPSTENLPNEADRGWVLMDTTMTAASFIGIENYPTRVEQQAHVLALAIKEWNLTESPESTTIAPITDLSVRQLDFNDFWFLNSKIGQATQDQSGGIDKGLKEVSSSTSAQ